MSTLWVHFWGRPRGWTTLEGPAMQDLSRSQAQRMDSPGGPSYARPEPLPHLDLT